MILTVRRTIYLIFIGLLIIGSIWLLLYLQGFRYNQTKGKLERTGALMIDSTPKGATIYLDNKIIKKTSPTTVQSLAPAEYYVEMSTPTLQPWKKKLPVKQSRVTFTSKVRLWPKQTDLTTITKELIQQTILSPNRESILYLISNGAEQGLWHLNLTSGKSTLLDRSIGITFKNAAWSASGHNVIITYSTGKRILHKLFNLETTTSKLINPLEKTTINSIQWGSDDNSVLIATNSGLYRFVLRTEVITLLTNESCTDVRFHDGMLITINKPSNNTAEIKIYNPKNLQPIVQDFKIPLSSNLSFMESGSEWLPILNEQSHVIYLLRSPLKYDDSLQILPNITELDWNTTSKRFIVNNNFEIWEHLPDLNTQNLLSRMSTIFKRVRGYLDEPYMFVAQKNILSVIEFDARDFQQQWVVGTLPSTIHDFYIDPIGKTVTILTNNGLYRLTVSPSTINVPSIN